MFRFFSLRSRRCASTKTLCAVPFVILFFVQHAFAGTVFDHGGAPPDSCTVFSWDTAEWDSVTVTVTPGAVPGEYGFQRADNRTLYGVRVFSDGSFEHIIGSHFESCPAVGGNFVNNWRLNYGPSGAGPTSITGEQAVFGGTLCDGGEGITVHCSATISIGSGNSTPTPTPTATPSPTPGADVKETDLKVGGNQKGNDCGMIRYSVHAKLVSLNLVDTPLKYMPARGPAVNFTVTYNERDNQQPTYFNYTNFGPKWTCNWLAYVVDDPTTQLPLTAVYMPGGGAEIYQFDFNTGAFVRDPQSHAFLIHVSENRYQRYLPDGSMQVFDWSDNSNSYPRKIFMTQWIDPSQNAVTITYDSSFRITAIADALGNQTTLAYDDPNDPLKVTKVTEPFQLGRCATFTYTDGQLTKITDEIGIESVIDYEPGTDVVSSVTTPYGPTVFTRGQEGSNRWIEIRDPEYGRERVEYRDNTPGIPATETVVPTGFEDANNSLNTANSFFWSKKAMELCPPVDCVPDYTRAKITHWLRNLDETVSGIAASEKAVLENRVWYAYQGQPDPIHVGVHGSPTKVARVLDDGSTQLFQYQYNIFGLVTK